MGGTRKDKRSYGTGQLYIKQGSYYGRWRTSDGRRLNRLLGPMRATGSAEGLTRAEAERVFRKTREKEEQTPRPKVTARITVDDAGDSLRRKQKLEGARKSYQEGCESMQRVHISPRLGSLPVTNVTRAHVEAVATAMLEKGALTEDAFATC